MIDDPSEYKKVEDLISSNEQQPISFENKQSKKLDNNTKRFIMIVAGILLTTSIIVLLFIILNPKQDSYSSFKQGKIDNPTTIIDDENIKMKLVEFEDYCYLNGDYGYDSLQLYLAGEYKGDVKYFVTYDNESTLNGEPYYDLNNNIDDGTRSYLSLNEYEQYEEGNSLILGISRDYKDGDNQIIDDGGIYSIKVYATDNNNHELYSFDLKVDIEKLKEFINED